METTAAETCTHCGHAQRRRGLYCELCSAPLAGTAGSHAGAPTAGSLMGAPQPSARPAPQPQAASEERAFRERAEVHRGILFTALGIPLAVAFAYAPFLKFMGWFLESLFHEVGHTALAIFTGHPAVPAISLSGHAAAVHGEPMLIMRIAVIAGSIGLAQAFLHGRARLIAFGTLGILYPLLIWTPLGDVMFLTSGHLGELAAGALCLWRCLYGEACHHNAERAAYGMLGWYLIGENIVLSFGLALSQSARTHYAGNGSFGLTNDYIRLAEDHLHVSLGTVGFAMGALALLVPIAVVSVFAVRR